MIDFKLRVLIIALALAIALDDHGEPHIHIESAPFMPVMPAYSFATTTSMSLTVSSELSPR